MSAFDSRRTAYATTRETVRAIDRDVSQAVTTLAPIESAYRTARRGTAVETLDEAINDLDDVVADWSYDTDYPRYETFQIKSFQDIHARLDSAYAAGSGGPQQPGPLSGGSEGSEGSGGFDGPGGIGGSGGFDVPGGGVIELPGDDTLFSELLFLLSNTIESGGELFEALHEPLDDLVKAYNDSAQSEYDDAASTIVSEFEAAVDDVSDLAAYYESSRVVTNLDALEDLQTDETRSTIMSDLRTAIEDADAAAFGSARSLVSKAIAGLETIATAKRDDLTDITDEFASSYRDEPTEAIDTIDGQTPILMLPTRLETRFVETETGYDLLVRVYPDDIHVDTHERELTDDEVEWGVHFWEQVWWTSHDVPTDDIDDLFDDDVLEHVELSSLPDDAEDRHAAVLERVWKQLADRYGERRAAWVKRALEPTDADLMLEEPQHPDDLPADIHEELDERREDVDRRPESWTRAPRARLMPDCWVATAESGGEAIRVASDTVTTPLSIGPDPGSLDSVTDASADPGIREGDMEWLFDFEVALDEGMALRIPLEEPSVDRLTVVGLSTVQDEADSVESIWELFDAHHYTDGLSFVESGTPTNDTRDDSAGSEPSGSVSVFERECNPPIASFGDDTDGGRVGHLLGLDLESLGEDTPYVFGRVPGAGQYHDRNAATMNAALWPATWGYYVPHMLAPHTWEHLWQTLGRDELLRWLEAFRRHFVTYVRGGGPLPTVRVNDQPYGILPTTDFTAWSSNDEYRVRLDASGGVRGADFDDEFVGNRFVESHLDGLLGGLRDKWETASDDVPTAHRHEDSAEFIAELLALSGTGYGYRLRNLLPSSVATRLATSTDAVDPADVEPDLDDSLFESITSMPVSPRIDTLFADQSAPPVLADHFDEGTLTPTLEALQTLSFGQLRLGYPAVGDHDLELFDIVPYPFIETEDVTLFGVLLYQGLLQEARLARTRIGAWYGDPIDPKAEKHGRDGHPQTPDHMDDVLGDTAWPLFPEPAIYEDDEWVLWNALDDEIPGDLATEFDLDSNDSYGDALRAHPGVDPAFAGLMDALEAMESIDPAVVERLFRETLDLASHRWDAWSTSLATRRLDGMRTAATEESGDDLPSGLYVGAYGYVENLEQRDSTTSKGYVHAPSVGQATTAAVFRSVHAARHDEYDELLGIDLSAHRVREATSIIEGVRKGHPLGALLGYKFERALHEDDEELDKYVYPFRAIAPLVEGKVDRDAEKSDDAAEREVVDGVKLLDRWDNASIEWGQEHGSEGIALPENDESDEVYRTIREILDSLNEMLDAVSDVLTAESVHQLVSGNPERAGSSLDALSRGEAPSDLDVLKTPRTGSTCTHRLVTLLDPDGGGSWSASSPRSEAAPALDTWVGTLFGDPEQVVCRAAFQTKPAVGPDEDEGTSAPDEWRVVTLTLADLSVAPLDVLYLVEGDQEAWGSELEERIAYHLRRTRDDVTADAEIRLSFSAPAEWPDPNAHDVDPSQAVGFGELLETARSVRDLVTSARPVDARDLTLPGEASQPNRDADVLRERADDAEAVLEAATETIAAQLDAFADPEGEAEADGSNGDGETAESDEDSSLDDEETDPSRIADKLVALVDAVESLPAAVVDEAADQLADVDPDQLATDVHKLVASAAGEYALVARSAAGNVVVTPDDQQIDGLCCVDPGESIDVSLHDETGSVVDQETADVGQDGTFAVAFDQDIDTGDDLTLVVRSQTFEAPYPVTVTEDSTEQSLVADSFRAVADARPSQVALGDALRDVFDATNQLSLIAIRAAVDAIDDEDWPDEDAVEELEAVLVVTRASVLGVNPPAGWAAMEALLRVVEEPSLTRELLVDLGIATPVGSTGEPADHYGLRADGPTVATRVADELREGVDDVDDARVAAPNRPDVAFIAASIDAVRSSLLVTTAFGVHGSVPVVPIGATSTAIDRVHAQAASVLEECDDRLDASKEAPDDADGQIQRLEALFGESFQVLPPFEPADASELGAALDADHSEDLQAGDPLAVETWFQRTARVRDGAGRLAEALTYGESLGDRSPSDGARFTVGQLPYDEDDLWIGLPEAWEDDHPTGKLSVVAHTHGSPASDRLVGLFVDEYVETVPAEEETTGVSFHYDAPGNRAPQTMLLAVPPNEDDWSVASLTDVVNESVELAKLRTVDREGLDELGHLLPALTLPTNERDSIPIPDTSSAVVDSLAPLYWPNITRGGAD